MRGEKCYKFIHEMKTNYKDKKTIKNIRQGQKNDTICNNLTPRRSDGATRNMEIMQTDHRVTYCYHVQLPLRLELYNQEQD